MGSEVRSSLNHAKNSPALTNKSYLITLQCLTPEPVAKPLTRPRIINEGTRIRQQPALSWSKGRAGEDSSRTWSFLGTQLLVRHKVNRNPHIPGVLSITRLESRFCDFRSQRPPVTLTFPGSSIASRLESIFYGQPADSRDFTEIAKKIKRKKSPRHHLCSA